MKSATDPDLYDHHDDSDLTDAEVEALGGVATAPGGSVCANKRWPDKLHADASWTTPKALCNIEAPIHPDDITTDDLKVTCSECRSILAWLAAHKAG
jgi:hypothetical protein